MLLRINDELHEAVTGLKYGQIQLTLPVYLHLERGRLYEGSICRMLPAEDFRKSGSSRRLLFRAAFHDHDGSSG